MKLHKCTHFLQDLAPFHKAKIVSKWFEDHPNIQLIKCPGNSPDLNPLENMWIFMKNRLKESKCTNLEEPKTKIMNLWTKEMGNIQYLRNFVESMHRCLQDVMDRDGSCTKY